jgi:hypothetical protein
MPRERQQVIRERAYALWEQEGKPNGHDLDHWLRAETEIEGSSTGLLRDNRSSFGTDFHPHVGDQTAASADATDHPKPEERPSMTEDDSTSRSSMTRRGRWRFLRLPTASLKWRSNGSLSRLWNRSIYRRTPARRSRREKSRQRPLG